jgi:hypothetical protein
MTSLAVAGVPPEDTGSPPPYSTPDSRSADRRRCSTHGGRGGPLRRRAPTRPDCRHVGRRHYQLVGLGIRRRRCVNRGRSGHDWSPDTVPPEAAASRTRLGPALPAGKHRAIGRIHSQLASLTLPCHGNALSAFADTTRRPWGGRGRRERARPASSTSRPQPSVARSRPHLGQVALRRSRD